MIIRPCLYACFFYYVGSKVIMRTGKWSKVDISLQEARKSIVVLLTPFFIWLLILIMFGIMDFQNTAVNLLLVSIVATYSLFLLFTFLKTKTSETKTALLMTVSATCLLVITFILFLTLLEMVGMFTEGLGT